MMTAKGQQALHAAYEEMEAAARQLRGVASLMYGSKLPKLTNRGLTETLKRCAKEYAEKREKWEGMRPA